MMTARLRNIALRENNFNIAMLVLRAGVGILMLHHGYDKFKHFSEYQADFMNFLGLGSSASLSLVIFAELFCSALILIGFYTSVFTIPLIVTMCVALLYTHQGALFAKGELAALYLAAYIAILIAGPGRYSVDALIAARMTGKKSA